MNLPQERRSRGRISRATQQHPAGTVHVITVCNETRLNVLDSGLMCELGSALATAGEDPDARAVVLHGAGVRAWIGGADIDEMASLEPETASGFISLLHGVCRTIREHPLPVIAAIQGYCLGAGLEVAACCDLRLADATSQFGMPEVKVGIPSVIEAAVLPRLVGSGRARDLVMTGRIINASSALAWGLVDEVCDAGDLDAALGICIESLLEAAPGALRAQKRLCRAWDEHPLDEAVKMSIAEFEAAFEGDEPARYMRRFLERRRTGPDQRDDS
jgi:enoyl-CoA hydratase/carnithine racemase